MRAAVLALLLLTACGRQSTEHLPVPDPPPSPLPPAWEIRDPVDGQPWVLGLHEGTTCEHITTGWEIDSEVDLAERCAELVGAFREQRARLAVAVPMIARVDLSVFNLQKMPDWDGSSGQNLQCVYPSDGREPRFWNNATGRWGQGVYHAPLQRIRYCHVGAWRVEFDHAFSHVLRRDDWACWGHSDDSGCEQGEIPDVAWYPHWRWASEWWVENGSAPTGAPSWP